MAYPVSLSIRSGIEDPYSGDVLLLAAEITHPDIIGGSLNLIGDTVDFQWNGKTWTSLADLLAEVKWVSDGDKPPRAQVSIQNVDMAIGRTVRGLEDSPRLDLYLLYSTDFDITVVPRVPLGTPQIIRVARRLRLSNVQCDDLALTADLSGFDYTREIAGLRATPEYTPGLYR